MSKPTVHLICNAHLDPVWQWQWEEGCAEALATFENAVTLLREHKELIFNHNEAVLYEWVRFYQPRLFEEIRKLVHRGRWCISGGWFLQPDVNMPGLESLIRQIAVGRRFFRTHFDAHPVVAYNFDSFGHGGGLPQVLGLAGYRMYIHLRPQERELQLPSDLYRWKGVDGSEILTYRIAVGLYHTERDNIEQRLQDGTELALRLQRDVPIFWGIGNHGGGATREDLERIAAFAQRESRVRIIHSTTEGFYKAIRRFARTAPVVEGDLQRIFTGCYTSLSRIKRRAQRSLGELGQAETLRTMSWWLLGQRYPDTELDRAWHQHLFNDFHDILPGSCTEPAEQDALDLYGSVSGIARGVRFASATAFNKGRKRALYVPVTVLNTNPSCARAPVEVECMLDLRPKWTGTWHLKLFSLDGKEITCQEEQPESLLPFNGWRRKVTFLPRLPHVGISRYELRIVEGEQQVQEVSATLRNSLDPQKGLVYSLDAGGGRECLSGYLLQPLVVDDDGDSWGSDRWSYRTVVGKFEAVKNSVVILQSGPVRTIVQSVFVFNKSKIVLHTLSYPEWPVLEFRMRVQWNEPRRRLKLSIPTVFTENQILCEIPGGAIYRQADGQEHVHGRWCMVEGRINGRQTALGIVNNGQHGLDMYEGEIRLSVLRSAAYCHEQGLQLKDPLEPKYMDLGIHVVHLLVTAGNPDEVRSTINGYADFLSSPPLVYSHLPIGSGTKPDPDASCGELEFLSVQPPSVRLTACKRSWDGRALVLRLHETTGALIQATLSLSKPARTIAATLKPFEVATLRVEKNGRWQRVSAIEE